MLQGIGSSQSSLLAAMSQNRNGRHDANPNSMVGLDRLTTLEHERDDVYQTDIPARKKLTAAQRVSMIEF